LGFSVFFPAFDYNIEYQEYGGQANAQGQKNFSPGAAFTVGTIYASGNPTTKSRNDPNPIFKKFHGALN
jgi:hypothetical protein